jgi:hypothetical protein
LQRDYHALVRRYIDARNASQLRSPSFNLWPRRPRSFNNKGPDFAPPPKLRNRIQPNNHETEAVLYAFALPESTGKALHYA